MAQRIERKKARPAPAAQPSDLEVLHPERELTLGGETVVMREYGNVEWLRMLPVAEPLVARIAAALSAEELPTYEQALCAIAEHVDQLLPLIVRAVDRDVAWFEGLQAGEVELLIMAWWGSNGHFFVERGRNRAQIAMHERLLAARAAASPSAGARSTPPSSPTATALGTSADTPSAS